MDDIYKSAKAFEHLFNYTYNFVIAYKKKLIKIQLDFKKEDFVHLVGLQYLSDLTLNKNPKTVFDKILNNDIKDEFLASSKFYLGVDNNYVVVADRICGFQNIENCLDGKSILFRYIKDKNKYSHIDADFMLEVLVDHIVYLIFFKERTKNNTYKLVSFFDKKCEYKGETAYWLYKEKKNNINNTSIILYDRLYK